MSTNYYVIPTVALEMDLNWVEKLHIAQYSVGGYLLQAVGGVKQIQEKLNLSDYEADRLSGVGHYSPVEELDSIYSWERWKQVLSNDNYTLINEYNDPVNAEDFITEVEDLRVNGTNRCERTLQWYKNYGMMDTPTVYMDAEGYSFEVRDFT